MKRILLLTSLLISQFASAQDAGTPLPEARHLFRDWINDPVVVLLFFLFLILMIAVIVLSRVILRLSGAGKLSKDTEVRTERIESSFWKNIDRKILTRAVPIEREADIMLDHNYDGIRELDNALPPWWKYGFYLTIIWAFIYIAYYHVMDSGKLQAAEYREQVDQAEAENAIRMAKMKDQVNEETVTLLADATALGNGKALFTTNCVACHLADGGGSVGPNLTDEYWLHGGGIKNVFKVITHGVPAKGMISWKAQFTPRQIQELASYVLTFQGTKPATGKEPQGEKWVEAASAVPALAEDSLRIQTDSSATAGK